LGLKLNGTHLLLSYADNVNILGDSIDTINKNTESLTDASKEVVLKVKVEKTKYTLVFCDQNAGQIRGMKIRNSSFETMSQFKLRRIFGPQMHVRPSPSVRVYTSRHLLAGSNSGFTLSFISQCFP
jgi:hypothetical protein